MEMDESTLRDTDLEELKVNRDVTDGDTEVEPDTLNEALGLDVAESDIDSAGVDDSFKEEEGDKEEVLVEATVAVETREIVLEAVVVKTADFVVVLLIERVAVAVLVAVAELVRVALEQPVVLLDTADERDADDEAVEVPDVVELAVTDAEPDADPEADHDPQELADAETEGETDSLPDCDDDDSRLSRDDEEADLVCDEEALGVFEVLTLLLLVAEVEYETELLGDRDEELEVEGDLVELLVIDDEAVVDLDLVSVAEPVGDFDATPVLEELTDAVLPLLDDVTELHPDSVAKELRDAETLADFDSEEEPLGDLENDELMLGDEDADVEFVALGL